MPPASLSEAPSNGRESLCQAVCNIETGKVEFDNYGGHWGNRNELDRFLQAYTVEKAKIEARRRGHSVTEHQLPNGAIKVTIHFGGVA